MGRNDLSFGTAPWAMPGNAAASDDAYATVLLRRESSNYLVVTGFGFTVPPGATIRGITVDVENSASGVGVSDARVRLTRGGTILPTDHASPVAWPVGVDGTLTYGSATDLWGATWTAADIDAADFGVAISAQSTGGGGGDTARIDHVQVRVQYTPACPVP